MRRIFAVAMMAALLPAPAFSQMQQGKQKTPLDLQYERERRDQEQTEKDYNAAMKRMKSEGPAPKRDPWAGVRPASSSDGKR